MRFLVSYKNVVFSNKSRCFYLIGQRNVGQKWRNEVRNDLVRHFLFGIYFSRETLRLLIKGGFWGPALVYLFSFILLKPLKIKEERSKGRTFDIHFSDCMWQWLRIGKVLWFKIKTKSNLCWCFCVLFHLPFIPKINVATSLWGRL